MMKSFYLLSVVIHVAAGCVLSGNPPSEITGRRGGSALLPCTCSDPNAKPQKLTWEISRPGHVTDVLNDTQFRGRVHQFNTNSPANLSLLISNLREEDARNFRCNTENNHRDIKLYVKVCDLERTELKEVTGFIGESVVLRCICTNPKYTPKSLKWTFNKPGTSNSQDIYPNPTGPHRNRVNLVNKDSPGNLSLLISHLTEEDQGLYRCYVTDSTRDFRLSVKRRRETATKPPSKPPQSKTTSPPAPPSTPHVFWILGVSSLVIFGVVAITCWKCKGSSGDVITERPQDWKKKQEQDKTDVTYSDVTHIQPARAALVQVNTEENTEYACIVKKNPL